MKTAHRDRESLVQNLEDAGCSPQMVERFLKLWEGGDEVKQLRLLAEHRQKLLEEVHRVQKEIDCLDYLVYQMKK